MDITVKKKTNNRTPRQGITHASKEHLQYGSSFICLEVFKFHQYNLIYHIVVSYCTYTRSSNER